MIFTKATMSNEKDECDKLTTPHDYYLWRTGEYSIPKKRFTPPDSWWFTVSMNSSEVYLLHVWEREVFKLPHRKTAKNATVDPSVETYRIKGRIECDCKSFIYSKLTPRCCKHSIELARNIFGKRTNAYKVVFNARQLDEPDEWCSHLFTVEEEIRLKQRDENRARLVDQRNSLAKRIKQAEIGYGASEHEREQIMKYKLQQKGQWKPNTLGVVYHD